MRFLLMLIFFSSTISTFSQKKYKPKVFTNELYVEFVDTIEYLEVRVDFDTLNKIEKTTILKERTTLKDSSKIKHYINKIKSLKVKTNTSRRIPPAIIRYRFVNEEFQNSNLTKKDKEEISKYFKNGTFKYNLPWNKVITKRKGSKQYTYIKDYISEYDVEWYSEDRYTITLVKTNRPNHKNKIGEKSYVEIIRLLSPKSYMFKTSLDGKNFTGIFTKID